MLKIILQRIGAGPLSVKNCPQCRIQRNVWRMNGEDAVYTDGLWRLSSGEFVVGRIETPVTIHFVTGTVRSAGLGPFESARIVGSILFGGKSAELPLACLLQPTARWQSYRDDTEWDAVEFTEVPTADAGDREAGQAGIFPTTDDLNDPDGEQITGWKALCMV